MLNITTGRLIHTEIKNYLMRLNENIDINIKRDEHNELMNRAYVDLRHPFKIKHMTTEQLTTVRKTITRELNNRHCEEQAKIREENE